jgi:hypothetical protein
MLQSRLAVVTAYLKAQPASYLTDSSLTPSPTNKPDHQILRSLAALETQLRLTSPEDVIGITQENDAAKTDVELISLLTSITQSALDVKTLSKRWQAVEPQKRKGMGGMLPFADTEPALTPGQATD